MSRGRLAGKIDCLPGGQLQEIRRVKDAVNGLAHVYAELKLMGAGLRYIDEEKSINVRSVYQVAALPSLALNGPPVAGVGPVTGVWSSLSTFVAVSSGRPLYSLTAPVTCT